MKYFYLYSIIVLACLIFYYTLKKIQWIVLLVGSVSFVFLLIKDPILLLIYILTCCISIFSAKIIKRINNILLKRIICVISIISVASYLLILRFIYVLKGLVDLSDLVVQIPGVAFYTLQMISYIIDVYRGNTLPDKNPFRTMLYLSFFPQFLQGPIPRHEQLTPQFSHTHYLKIENVKVGCIQIVWGIFLKVLIADRLSLIVNPVFQKWQLFSGIYYWIAAVAFSIQLYCDFQACVYISRGTSTIFDISIVNNFNRPYLALSVNQFWKRWHISLSSWLRDYIYIPLGGNRRGLLRRYLNLFITFIISGVWHGGQLHYIIWGAMHGVYLISESTIASIIKRNNKIKKNLRLQSNYLVRGLKRIIVFILVAIAWVMFRANNTYSGIRMIISMFTVWNPWKAIRFYDEFGISYVEWYILLFSILMLMVVEFIQERGTSFSKILNEQSYIFSIIVAAGLIVLIVLFGAYGSGFDNKDFIYASF